MSEPVANKNNTDLAFKLVLFLAIAAIFFFTIYKLKILIVCIILAITLASAIAPLAEKAARKKIPRFCIVLLIYLLAALVYGLLAASFVPTVREQWQTLGESIPEYISGFNHQYERALSLAGNNANALTIDTNEVRLLLMKVFEHTLDVGSDLVGLLLSGLLILLLAAYFVVDADKIWAAILKWLPSAASTKFAPLINPLANRMGGYVRGQLLVALSVAIFLMIGFSILGIKYALILGLLAGVLNLVPYIGSMIAALFATIIAFNQAPILVGAILILYCIEQWVESTLLVPFFLGQQIALHPLIVLFAMLSGVSLMGMPGALISVPLVSAAMYIAEEFYLKPKRS